MKIKWPPEFPGANWYDKAEERAVVQVVRNGAPFRYYGAKKPRFVLAYEAAARRFYGVKHALAVNSGTGALMTAMNALGIGPGDEVIVPSFFWVATVGAVVAHNAIPVLCEIDDSFTMDPADLARKITPRTRLIVPVHMTGGVCDMKSIMAIANQRGITVLEDCAQCNGGTFAGRKVGTFGRAGMFSLQINKNCTTGEGGLLVTDDEQLYWKLNAAHDVGVPWVGGGPKADMGVALWGSGRRMSELIGAAASVQMRKLPAILKHMRQSKNRIKAMLQGTPGLGFRRQNDPAGDTASFLTLILSDEPSAVAAAQRLRDGGIGASHLPAYGMHLYYNIPQLVNKVPLSAAGNPWSLPQNAQSVFSYAKGACPRSDALLARSIVLPIPSVLTRAQEQRAAKIIRGAVTPAGLG